MKYDCIIIGAGPAGLACAIAAKEAGVEALVIDKGCLVNSIYHFPADMVFFSTPELMSIGETVFVSPSFRPTRIEALNYYRVVASHYGLNIATYEKVTAIRRVESHFVLDVSPVAGGSRTYEADRVIVATGYYDQPNMLGVPGEGLPHVCHYYHEAHPYQGRRVAIIGAKNSAVEAALTLQRVGADVTLIHRGEGLSGSVKYWVRPDIEKRIESGAVKTLFGAEVVAIHPDHLDIRNNKSGEQAEYQNDFLFALTGYRPDEQLLREAGVDVDSETIVPAHNSETLETNVPGLYVAGSIAAGINNNKIFIENSRDHGRVIFPGG